LLDVPLVIRAPGRLTPGLRAEPVMLCDLFATVLAFAGVEYAPLPAQSRNLLLKPPRDAAERPVMAEYAGPPGGLLKYFRELNADLDVRPLAASYRTVRVRDLRLTVGSAGTVELHDLAADPSQRQDLAAERPADLAAMQAVLGRQPFRGWLIDKGRLEIDAETRRQLRALGYVR
jgi:arylsulfatase A-like enzyme